MSSHLHKTGFLSFVYLFSIQVILPSTNCLTLQKNVSDDYNEYCFHWIRTLTSTNFIFFHVNLEERIVERSQVYGSSCILHVDGNSGRTSSSKFCHDFVIFIDTRGTDFTEDCVSKTIRIEMLTVQTKLIICDKSQEIPQHLRKPGALQFLGSANALYVTKSDCWSAGPFYLLRRTFGPTENCPAAPWLVDADVLPLPDMRGETLRVITLDRLLFSVIHRNESDPTKRYDGIEVKIFLEAARILNFTWVMEEIGADVSNKYGKLVDGRWHGGVMEAVTSGRCDLMLAAFWITNLSGLDYSYSWSYLKLVFLVPRPTLLGSSWANLVRPFQVSLWLSVCVLVLAFPLTAWTVERLYMVQHPDHRPSHRLSGYLLYTAGSLTGGSGELASPRAPYNLKPLVTSWYVVVLLLYACYTSNIASILTIPSYEPPIDTVQQLVEQNFSWGRTYYVDFPTKFVQMEDYWQRRFVQHYVTYDASDERRLLLGRKFALYAQVLEGSEHILLDSAVEDDLVKGLRLMKEGLREYRVSTAIREHSPFTHFYDRVVVRLFEHGIIHNFKAVALRKYQKSSYDTFRADPDVGLIPEPAVLALDDFKYIFYILVAGWAVSSACFALELYARASESSGRVDK